MSMLMNMSGYVRLHKQLPGDAAVTVAAARQEKQWNPCHVRLLKQNGPDTFYILPDAEAVVPVDIAFSVHGQLLIFRQDL